MNINSSINLNVRNLGKSPTLAINERSKFLQSQGKKIYKLGFGQSPFPVPEIVVNELKKHAFEKDYLEVQGLQTLRKAVAEFHNRYDETNFNDSNIMIGPGSKDLMFILQLCHYSDLILPSPSWVSYVPQSNILGRKVNYIHTKFENDWRLKAEELEKYCLNEDDEEKPRLLVLNYPSNPDGGSYNEDDLKDLAKVARKYNILILSDEIYGMLNFDGKHNSIVKYYPEGTIISSGLSKWCGAGGWRLGTFAFPDNLKKLQKRMINVASETYTSVSSPIQYAAIKAFQESSEINEYLNHQRRVLKKIAYWCFNEFKNANVKVNDPKGGFYLFPDFYYYKESLFERGIYDNKEFCNRLLEETGVAVLPGSAFGRNESEFTCRLAFVDFDGKKVLEESKKIPLENDLPDDFITNFCENVLDAITKIVNWVSN